MDEQQGTDLLQEVRTRPRGIQKMLDIPCFKANAFTGFNSSATLGD